MKVLRLTAKNYRSLRNASVKLDDLNLFIGANASGKSAILDAMRFLSEAVQARDFRAPVHVRGGILNLVWKGQDADRIELAVTLSDAGRRFEWLTQLVRQGHDFYVAEQVREITNGHPPSELLNANNGRGSWCSGEKAEGVSLLQAPTACALAAAAADASFPARAVAEFVGQWGFFDPSPFLLRRDWNLADAAGFDDHGRNLGATLYAMREKSPATLNKVVAATQSIIGLPTSIEPRMSEDRFYFVQHEPGLQSPVNQLGVSSGTLRMLALMTALYGQPGTALIGIEEPENYIHPSALSAFVEHVISARRRVQLLITTHSPLMLDYLNDPAALNIVKRDEADGTVVRPELHPDKVRQALEVSGFGLGEYYETSGFGA